MPEPEMTAGFDHVRTALEHAIRAWKEGQMIARSLEVEVLLCRRARQTGLIGPFGPENGTSDYYLMYYPSKTGGSGRLLEWMEEVNDEDWNEMSENKASRLIRAYNITTEELEVTGMDRLGDLIRERSALLAVNR